MNRRRTLLSLLASAAGASVDWSLGGGLAHAATLAPHLLLKETARGLAPAPGLHATYTGLAQVGPGGAPWPVRDRWRWAVPARLTVETTEGTGATWQAPEAHKALKEHNSHKANNTYKTGDAAVQAGRDDTAADTDTARHRLLPPAVVCAALATLFGPEGLVATLVRWGIDRRAVRLALADSTPCHVLGGEGTTSDRPAALWIDHQHFRVRRLVLPGADAPQVDLLDWQGPLGRGVLPEHCVISLRGRIVRDLRLTRVETGP